MFSYKSARFWSFLVFTVCVCMTPAASSVFAGNVGEPTNLLKQTEVIAELDESAAMEAVSEIDKAEETNAYRLNPDDVIDVTVYGEKELSKEYTLDQKGMVSMPLIGNIYVQGLTARQVEELIKAKLSEGFLIDPSINVGIVSVMPFYILGEVRIPGSYDFVNNMTVLNAVALAGGFTYRANKDRVKILRPNQEKNGKYEEASVSDKVNPGDIILIKEKFF